MKPKTKELDIDIKKVHQIVKEASGNNWALTNYTPIPGLTDGVPSNNKYRPGFTAAMMKKEGYKVSDFGRNEVSGLHLITVLPSKLDGAYDKRREGKVVYLNEK